MHFSSSFYLLAFFPWCSGNIIVELKDKQGGEGTTATPGLIDFGITVELNEAQRLGFCRTVVAAAESDSFSLLQSFADMDIVLNRADPTASLDTIRHLFRSTASREDTMKQDKAFMERARARDEANIDSGIAVDRREEGGAASKIGSSSRAAGKDKGGRSRISSVFRSVRGNASKQSGKQVQPAASKPSERRNPVDAYPGFLVFLFRTLGLLRGLSTRLSVEHTYLPIMHAIAVSALHDAVPPSDRAKSLVYEPAEQGDGEKPVKSLQSRKAIRLRKVIVRVCEELHKRKLFIGCQVAVYLKGEIVLDLAAGTMGKHNIRPVLPSTLFCPFSATKGVCALLFAQLADEYDIQSTDLVSKWWPAFGCKGKELTTVAMLLGHRAGLAQCSPDDMSMNRLRDDWQGIVDWLATEATPSHPPGQKVEYHALNFGWLVAGLLQSVTKGTSIKDRLNALAVKLGIEDECFLGLSKEMAADVANSRIAMVSNEIYGDINRIMKLQARAKEDKDSDADASDATSRTSDRSAAQQGENVEALYSEGDTGMMNNANLKVLFERILSGQQASADSPSDSVATPDAAAPSEGTAGSDFDRLDGDKRSRLGDLLAKTPYLAEPTFFSHPVLREAVVPAANGHFSARALAKMFSVLAQDGKSGEEQILSPGRTAKMMEVDAEQVDAFGAGVRVYSCLDRRGRSVDSKAMGHSGIGGSVAFAVPDNEFSMAFTCNQLNAVSAAGSLLVSAVCAVLNVPAPEAYAGLLHKLREEHASGDGDMEAALGDLDGDIDKAVANFSLFRALTG